jgi:hypothetical protein
MTARALLRRVICCLVSISIAVSPVAYAQAQADAASVAAGNAFGATLAGGVSPTYDAGTGSVSAGGQPIFTLTGASSDMSAQAAAGNSKTALTSAVGAQLGTLTSTGSKGGSAAGSAYQTLMSAQGNTRPDLSNDATVTNAESGLRATIHSADFGDCKQVTTVVPTAPIIHSGTTEVHCDDMVTGLTLYCPDGGTGHASVPVVGSGSCVGTGNFALACDTKDSSPVIALTLGDGQVGQVANTSGTLGYGAGTCQADYSTQISCAGGGCASSFALAVREYVTTYSTVQDCHDECSTTFSGGSSTTTCHNVCTSRSVPTSAWQSVGSGSLRAAFAPTPAAVTGNMCAKYQANSNCTETAATCLATDANGNCGGYTRTYSCKYTEELPGTGQSQTVMQCPGKIACMGTTCGAKPAETNQDFSKAAATLQMLSNAAKEGTDCDANGNCAIFKGKSSDCKKAMFGMVDCCNQPTSVSYIDYIKLAYATTSLMDRFETTREYIGTAKGIWQDVTQPVTDTASSVWTSISNTASSAVTSIRDSLVTGDSVAATGAEALDSAVANAEELDSVGFFEGVKSGMVNHAVTWAADIFPGAGIAGAEGSGALFTANAAGDYALNVAGNAFASALSVIGLVYTVYSIAKVIISMIYACTPVENTLAVNRELRLCHDVGSFCAQKALGVCLEKKETYCCYPSMLGRIMNEQVRGQLGAGFGTPEVPHCEGITTAQLGSADMSTIDLTEWIESLKLAGITTNSATDAQLKFSQQQLLTSGVPGGTTRADPVAKTKALLGTGTNPAAVDQYRQQQQKTAYQALQSGVLPPAP